MPFIPCIAASSSVNLCLLKKRLLGLSGECGTTYGTDFLHHDQLGKNSRTPTEIIPADREVNSTTLKVNRATGSEYMYDQVGVVPMKLRESWNEPALRQRRLAGQNDGLGRTLAKRIADLDQPAECRLGGKKQVLASLRQKD